MRLGDPKVWKLIAFVAQSWILHVALKELRGILEYARDGA
jgi:hypothetical protein